MVVEVEEEGKEEKEEEGMVSKVTGGTLLLHYTTLCMILSNAWVDGLVVRRRTGGDRGGWCTIQLFNQGFLFSYRCDISPGWRPLNPPVKASHRPLIPREDILRQCPMGYLCEGASSPRT